MSPSTSAVIWSPDDAESAVQAVLDAAAEERRLRIAGTQSRRWLHPAGDAAEHNLLELKALDQLVWIDSEDRTCCVQAGMRLADLQAVLAEHGLMLPYFDGSEGTVGGAFVGGSPSLTSKAWGLPRDQVLGGKWLLPDGRIVRSGSRVVKSVAGYDVTRLFLGSRGRLAACLELTLRLRPRPTAWAGQVLDGASTQPLPSGLCLATEVPHATGDPGQATHLRLWADPAAVPPGTSCEFWSAADAEKYVFQVLRDALNGFDCWTYPAAESALANEASRASVTPPCLIDHMAGLHAWKAPQAARSAWPPSPSPWLERVQSVVAGEARPFG